MGTRDAGLLLGIPLDKKSLEETAEEALQAIDRRIPPIIFAYANPHSLVVTQGDLSFQSALTQPSLAVAGGVGVTFMARLVGVQVGARITGTDYFQIVLKALQKRGRGHDLLQKVISNNS